MYGRSRSLKRYCAYYHHDSYSSAKLLPEIYTNTSHSPRFALAIHFSELVAINLLFNAGAYL